jgi:pyruvate dehydrogenase complex dehydrogenase (E1) component
MDAESIVVAALSALARDGKLPAEKARAAIERLAAAGETPEAREVQVSTP